MTPTRSTRNKLAGAARQRPAYLASSTRHWTTAMVKGGCSQEDQARQDSSRYAPFRALADKGQMLVSTTAHEKPR